MNLIRRKKFVQFIFVVFTMVFLLAPFISHAATIDQLNQQKSSYSSQAAEAKKKAAEKQKEADALNAQVKSLNGQISDTERALNATEQSISDTQATINDLQNKIKTEEENLAKEKAKLDKVVTAWYMEGDDSGLITTLIGSDNLSSAITKNEYYDSIKNQITEYIKKIEQLKAELAKQKADQDAKYAELKQLEERQQLQKSGLQSQKWTKDKLLTDTTNTIAQLKEEEKKATALEKSVESQINSLLAAKVKSGIPQGGPGAGSWVNQGDVIGYEGSTGYSTGPHVHFMVFFDGNLSNNRDPRGYIPPLSWPLSNFRVTQEYGWTDYAQAGAYGGAIHNGIDITDYLGAPIKAPASGNIVLRQYFGGYGNAVVINHGNNMYTLCGHMN